MSKASKIKGQFVPVPPDMFVSDAWRSMQRGHFRIFGALCKEHASKGGKGNGWLKLPHRQIVGLGIAPRNVSRFIHDLEEWGLIACQRGGMRSPIRYALTWLPTADGAAPTDAWRHYSAPEIQKSAHEKEGSPAHGKEGRWPNLHTKRKADAAPNLHAKRKALSREGSIPGGAGYSVPRGGTPPGGAAVVPFAPSKVGAA